MNATTLDQKEAVPDVYPTVAGLSEKAAAIDAAHVWQRIESYIAQRWTPRGVVWIVEGPGEWTPPIAPAVVASVAAWSADAWGDSTPVSPCPLGFSFADGFWQVTATVGNADDALPAAVAEAFRRLAEYVATVDTRIGPGVSRYALDLDGLTETISRRENHMARALINSGAADLLRPYRRV